jgi:hypothetical protein
VANCLQDASGCTALMQLLQAGKLSDARALLSHGDCNVNAVMISPPGHSALMMGTMGLSAGAEVDMALVEALLAQGASPDLQVHPPLLASAHCCCVAQHACKGTGSDTCNAAGDV